MSRKLFNENALSAWKEIDPENWKTIVIELINIFLEIAPDQIKQLDEAWSCKNVLSVRQVAHSLKSSCGNVGAELAQDLLGAIEVAAAKEDFKTLDQLVPELLRVFKSCHFQIVLFIKNNQAA